MLIQLISFVFYCLVFSSPFVKLKEIYSIGSKNSSDVFIDIEGITTDEKYLYVTDKALYKYVCYDKKNGRKVFEAGKRGTNNGEFRGPGTIAANSNRIAVADFGSSRIQLFVKEKFLSGFNSKGITVSTCFDSKNNLWVSTYSASSENNLFKYSSDGSLDETITLKNSSSDMWDCIFFFALDKKNSILVCTFYSRNIVEIWQTNGKFIKSFSVPGLPAKVPRRNIEVKKSFFTNSLSAPDGNIFVDVEIDQEGFIYLLTGDFSENPYQEVYVCNIRGEFLGQFTLPEKSTQMCIDDNKLYCVTNNKSVVRVYDFSYSKSKRK